MSKLSVKQISAAVIKMLQIRSSHCNTELNLKFCENLNFITFDKLNINLGKTYAKLRIFPKIF